MKQALAVRVGAKKAVEHVVSKRWWKRWWPTVRFVLARLCLGAYISFFFPLCTFASPSPSSTSLPRFRRFPPLLTCFFFDLSPRFPHFLPSVASLGIPSGSPLLATPIYLFLVSYPSPLPSSFLSPPSILLHLFPQGVCPKVALPNVATPHDLMTQSGPQQPCREPIRAGAAYDLLVPFLCAPYAAGAAYVAERLQVSWHSPTTECRTRYVNVFCLQPVFLSLWEGRQ